MGQKRKPPLSIRVPPGIGDFSWIYSKLAGLGHPLHVEVVSSNHDRTRPLLDLLPLVEECRYVEATNPVHVGRGLAEPDWDRARLVEEATARVVPFELNRWLEGGNRIEEFMPTLPTYHHYPISFEAADVDRARKALGGWNGFIAFYCANRDTNRRWGGWSPEEWVRLAQVLWASLDLDGFALIGAGWDRGFAARVKKGLRMPVINLVGKLSLGASLQLVRRAAYLVAFPSGIPILAAVMRRPVWMFYPAHLEGLRYAWAPPAMIASGDYRASGFCAPEDVCAWLTEEYGIRERLEHTEGKR